MAENENPGVQTPESVAALNRELLTKIMESGDGEIKQASTAGTNMIKRRIREEGFTRRIIPPQTVTNEDLDRVVDHDRPVIIEDMEPMSRGAVTLPFGASTDSEWFYGNKYVCVFDKISTPEFTKDINELRTYKMDLRQVITDNALKDVQTEEDGRFIAMVDRIVGTEETADGAAGVQQNFAPAATGFTRANYKEVLKVLNNQMLNTGIILMNRNTGLNFVGMGRDDIGGDLSEEFFREGLSALKEAKIMGVKHLFTIKRDLVPDNVVYIFTEPGYLGKFYELQTLVMYVEKKKDILRFSANETLSVTIANVAGVARFRFTA
jgi:hypothetical protein